MISAELIKEYLEYNFGGNVAIEPWVEQTRLPIYLTSTNKYYQIKYYKSNFLMIDFSNLKNKGIDVLKKQIKQVIKYTNTNEPIVLVFSEATNYLRNKLIEEKISFVIPGKQIYVPFIGAVFSDHRIFKFVKEQPEENYEVNKFTPSAQSLLLELLINNNLFETQEELAKKLGVSKMSISRAFKELKRIRIFNEIQEGNKTILKFSDTKRNIWEKVNKYFIDPKKEVKYVLRDSIKNELNDKLIRAGESALSDYSMLAEPKYESFSITKKEWDLLKEKPEIIPAKDEGVCLLEIWKHKIPSLFGCVHPLGLIVSMSTDFDERIQGELEFLLDQYDWREIE